MDMKHDPQSLLTELSARREKCHRKVDEQINMELCRLALGDKAEVGYDYQSAVVICCKPRQGGIAVEEVMADRDHDLEVEPALPM